MSGCGGAGSLAKPLSLLLCSDALLPATPLRAFGLATALTCLVVGGTKICSWNPRSHNSHQIDTHLFAVVHAGRHRFALVRIAQLRSAAAVVDETLRLRHLAVR